MSLRGTWYTITQHMPKPAWIKYPNQQRFCCCCSIRTGASLIGWFNFIINSLYIGMLLLLITTIRNLSADIEAPHKLQGTLQNILDPSNGSQVIYFTLPIMYKSICVPAIIVIFSILWLITVEASKVIYVQLFGKAFILSILVQLIAQLGFLIYIEIEARKVFASHVSVVVWLVFVVYATMNIYFVPILNEFIRRRIRECNQGMEQGLLTSEMYPRARVAEEYIQDAFTVEPDTDMVHFEASLVTSHKPDNYNSIQSTGTAEKYDDEPPI